jgi:predicted nucleic acid-binding protein
VALRPTHLADKSTLARMQVPDVRRRLEPLLVEGLVATCGVVDLEVGYSAHNAEVHAAIRRERRAMPRVPIDDDVLDRALVVQGILAASGRHRLTIPDLVIAACAERADLAVLHYDADYERIAAVTGQRHEWVVPRGSL